MHPVWLEQEDASLCSHLVHPMSSAAPEHCAGTRVPRSVAHAFILLSLPCPGIDDDCHVAGAEGRVSRQLAWTRSDWPYPRPHELTSAVYR